MSLPIRTRIFIAFLGLLALASMAFYLPNIQFLSAERVLAFVLFLVLGFLSEVYAVWIPSYGSEISSSISICIASLFILGPPLAVLMVLLMTLSSEILMRWDHLRADPKRFSFVLVFNISQLVVTVAVTGLVFLDSGGASLALSTGSDYLRAMLAFVCYAAINVALVATVVSLSEGQKFLHRFKTYIRDFSVQYLVLSVLALLLAVLYSQSVWHMFLAIVPLFLVHLSFRSYQKLRTEARRTFENISRLLDERDHYTAVHSSEVAKLAVRIGQELGLSHGDLERIDVAARVHDIGKIAVPDSILLKPGPLDDVEWQVMKTHPVTSAELIAGIEIYSSVTNAVRHEHERWDGSGYPDGLQGEEIPHVARIIAAADIYNALTTDRPYRSAYGHEETVEMIREMRGADLEPSVADALLRVIECDREREGDASGSTDGVG